MSGAPSVSADRRSIDPDSVALALRRWLFSGSCQSVAGAFCAWREARTGRLAFEYSENNGYLLTYAAALEDPTPAELAAARRSADWLARGDLSARASWDGGAIYTFDAAMTATRLKPDSGIAK